MKKISFFIGVLLLVAQSSFAQPKQTLDLMPVPQQLKVNNGKLRIDSSFRLAIQGKPDQRFYKSATRFLRRLDEQTILWFTQDQITGFDNDKKALLQIQVQRPGEIKLKEDESYQLDIDNNQIKISAVTDIGAMYGLETLLQLLEADENGFYFPHVSIKDSPRFPWRGLMIDVVRHWIPYEVIIRNIDAMLALKMNVLHLHLTDDQGFRVESKAHPLLHEKGSNGKYFTQAQLKDIVKYATDRGVRVVPEFDMPGHASSWFPGYPEYASAPGTYEIETEYSHFEPAPTMDPTNEKLYPFIDAFISEMTKIFPDEYIHIGGDENRGVQWDNNAKIQEFKKTHDLKSNMELQTYFNGKLQKILTKYNRKMMGWDEILEPGVSKDIMIHSWRGKKSLNEAAKKGYPVIISSGFYVDLLYTAEEYYLNEPLAESDDLTPSQLENVYGGESAMWAELVTAETIDSRTWPFTAAIAERLWSPREVRDVKDMYRRLEVVSNKLEYLGISHNKNHEVMLKRLANGNDITALKTFIDVVEPMKKLSRRKQGIIYYTRTPLTMIADVARPDSKIAREFSWMIDDFLKTPNTELGHKIKSQYQIWIDNHPKLLETMKLAPAVREATPMSENLAKLSVMGTELVDYLLLKSANKLKRKSIMTANDYLKKEEELNLMVKPQGNVEVTVLIKATKKLLKSTQD